MACRGTWFSDRTPQQAAEAPTVEAKRVTDLLQNVREDGGTLLGGLMQFGNAPNKGFIEFLTGAEGVLNGSPDLTR